MTCYFRPGDQLGRYTIERVLGAGGMGLVYAAHDPDLDRRVAIKVLRGDAAEESRVRLLREARAMAKLSHPNVITVYEVGTASGVDFVAMELLENGTPRRVAARRAAPDLAEVLKPVPRRRRRAWSRRTRAGWCTATSSRPTCLLGRDGRGGGHRLRPRPRLRQRGAGRDDAGVAREPADGAAPGRGDPGRPRRHHGRAPPTPTPTTSRSQPVDLSSTLTRTGALLGTPAYMAPEQFASGNVGPAADQFAFAVALFEGLTGARPFRGATLDELRGAILSVTPDVGALPRAVRPVVARALAREPSARWPDMRAMLAALDRRLRPRQLRVGVAAALAIGAIAGGVY
jgi:serine/threonine protein kinase